jgi:hypothetical protein
MTRTPLLITLAVAAALAGCSKENHTIVAGPDGDEANQTNVATNAPVALPPSIASSKSYRCADNSIVFIDWMSDGTAHVKMKRDAVGTPVAPGDLKGDPTSSSITFKGQVCKA